MVPKGQVYQSNKNQSVAGKPQSMKLRKWLIHFCNSHATYTTVTPLLINEFALQFLNSVTMKYFPFMLSLLNVALFTGAIQPVKNPAHWVYTASLKSPSVIELRFQARIDKGWHVYSPNNTQETSPMPASLTLSQSNTYQPLGKLKSIGAVRQYETVLGVETELFRKQAVLVQEVRLSKPVKFLSGVIKYEACTDKEGVCMATEVPFKVALK